VAGHRAPGLALLTLVLHIKSAETGSALFFRGVLCNFLCCLAVWAGGRTNSDGARLALIFWCLLAFIGSGFEHVVTNMTVYALGLFEHVPAASAGAFGRNMLLVGSGNLVGGALLIGASYGYLGYHGHGAKPAMATSPPAGVGLSPADAEAVTDALLTASHLLIAVSARSIATVAESVTEPRWLEVVTVDRLVRRLTDQRHRREIAGIVARMPDQQRHELVEVMEAFSRAGGQPPRLSSWRRKDRPPRVRSHGSGGIPAR
jgi:hypothetical protein